MPRRHPSQPSRPALPRLWLMTDERQGDALWPALAALPRGAGVVFRHHHTPAPQRHALLRRIRAVARARRLILLVGAPAGARPDGVHGRAARRPAIGLLSRPVHSRREAVAARRAGADVIFVSPVFATRSHPGAPALGASRAAGMVRGLGIPAIALGGMDRSRARALRRLGFHGWAAIDALTPGVAPHQKRNAVPI